MAEEQNYTVEQITGHKPKTAKKAADTKEYHIKWEGFGNDEKTWEPADNLNNAMIKEYWKSIKNNSDDKISAKDVAKKVTAKNEPEEEIEEYAVEAITGVLPKTASSDEEAKKYTIKWEGFGDNEKTNEPAEQIRKSAPECVTEFWKTKNADEQENDGEEEEPEEEVKLSKRGRRIKQIKPIVKPEPKEPSRKKTKITPSKSKKRPSPTKREAKETSPATKLQDDDEEELSEGVKSLYGRVDVLENEKGKWSKDRQLLKDLCKRDDLPKKFVDEIQAYLAESE